MQSESDCNTEEDPHVMIFQNSDPRGTASFTLPEGYCGFRIKIRDGYVHPSGESLSTSGLVQLDGKTIFEPLDGVCTETPVVVSSTYTPGQVLTLKERHILSFYWLELISGDVCSTPALAAQSTCECSSGCQWTESESDCDAIEDEWWTKTDIARATEDLNPSKCYYGIWTGSACYSDGGVYLIDPEWYSVHPGGTFKNCGSVVTNWFARSGSHESTAGTAIADGKDIVSGDIVVARFQGRMHGNYMYNLADELTCTISAQTKYSHYGAIGATVVFEQVYFEVCSPCDSSLTFQGSNLQAAISATCADGKWTSSGFRQGLDYMYRAIVNGEVVGTEYRDYGTDVALATGSLVCRKNKKCDDNTETGPIGATSDGSNVYFEVCSPCDASVKFMYSETGEFSQGPTCEDGKWTSSAWTQGNPSYTQQAIVDGEVFGTANETTALAKGSLVCRKSAGNNDNTTENLDVESGGADGVNVEEDDRDLIQHMMGYSKSVRETTPDDDLYFRRVPASKGTPPICIPRRFVMECKAGEHAEIEPSEVDQFVRDTKDDLELDSDQFEARHAIQSQGQGQQCVPCEEGTFAPFTGRRLSCTLCSDDPDSRKDERFFSQVGTTRSEHCFKSEFFLGTSAKTFCTGFESIRVDSRTKTPDTNVTNIYNDAYAGAWVAILDSVEGLNRTVSFDKGDIIIDVSLAQDLEGWYNGTVVRTGERGAIHTSFVVRDQKAVTEVTKTECAAFAAKYNFTFDTSRSCADTGSEKVGTLCTNNQVDCADEVPVDGKKVKKADICAFTCKTCWKSKQELLAFGCSNHMCFPTGCVVETLSEGVEVVRHYTGQYNPAEFESAETFTGFTTYTGNAFVPVCKTHACYKSEEKGDSKGDARRGPGGGNLTTGNDLEYTEPLCRASEDQLRQYLEEENKRYKPFYIAAFSITGTCGFVWCYCGISIAKDGDKWTAWWHKGCASFVYSFLACLRIFDMMSDWAFRLISLNGQRWQDENMYWSFMQKAGPDAISKVDIVKHCALGACVVGSLLLIPDLYSISVRYEAESKTGNPDRQAFKKVALGICGIIWLEDIPQLAMTAIYLRAVNDPFFDPEGFQYGENAEGENLDAAVNVGNSTGVDNAAILEGLSGFLDTVIQEDTLALISFVLSTISLLFNLYYAMKALVICTGKNKPLRIISRASKKIRSAASSSFKRRRETANLADGGGMIAMIANPMYATAGAASIPASGRVTEFRVTGCTGSERGYNGEYAPDGTFHGKAKYRHTTNSERSIEWYTTNRWRLVNGANWDFRVPSYAARPPMTGWVRDEATSAVPMIQDLKLITRTSSDT